MPLPFLREEACLSSKPACVELGSFGIQFSNDSAGGTLKVLSPLSLGAVGYPQLRSASCCRALVAFTRAPQWHFPAMAVVLLLLSGLQLCITAAILQFGGSPFPASGCLVSYLEEAAQGSAKLTNLSFLTEAGFPSACAVTLPCPEPCFSFQGNRELSLSQCLLVQ